MAASIFEQDNDTVLSSDDNTDWQDTSAVTTLDVEIDATAFGLPDGDTEAMSEPNVSFYLEGQYDDNVEQLWQAVFFQPTVERVSVGPGLEVDRVVPDAVRIRWTLNGGTVTAGMQLIGK